MNKTKALAVIFGLAAAFVVARRVGGGRDNPMRVTREEFRQLPLRAHTFLADVPPHDVWVIHLRGGESRTLHDFHELFSYDNVERANPIVRGLFKLRWALRSLFDWDYETHQVSDASYVHRLTEDDRDQSLDEPGSAFRNTPFRVIYTLENESLNEIINFTVHAFSLMTMELAEDGYTVYWAIYTKRVNWFTPVYLTLIDPFRWVFVYPAVIKRLERAWGTTYTQRINTFQ